MQRVLRLKLHLSPHILDSERVFLLGGKEPMMLRGRSYPLIVPLLNGRRSNAQILSELSGRAPAPELLLALINLERQGCAVEALPCPLDPAVGAFWEAQGLHASLVAERLLATPIQVHGLSGIETAPLQRALCSAGLRVQGSASFHLVAVPDYLDPAVEAFSRKALEERLHWMPIKPSGPSLWFGPVFHPGGQPCWSCLAERLRLNRPVDVFLEHRGISMQNRMFPETEASFQAGAQLAALAIARRVADASLDRLQELLTIDLLHPQEERHYVPAYPQCPSCGDPALIAAQAQTPVLLQPRPKRFTLDGGHRMVSPEETFARFSREISPLTGIVSSMGPVPERDHPLRPVYGSAYRIRPVHAEPSFEDFHKVAMGKGRTREQARASALCEAIERHSLGFRGDEPHRRATFEELGEHAIHPNALQNFSETQFAAREQNNATTTDVHRHIPLPFHPRAVIDWSPAWSLTHNCRRWVPAAYCYTHVPIPPEERFCYVNANGHASGNCVEEAILQAFFELIERDAVGIWWYNRLQRAGVDLESFGEPYFLELVAHYRALGYTLWVLDVSTELDIPAFAALAVTGGDRWCVGFGCHLEARLGIQRAMTELNQLFDPSASTPVPWDVRGLSDFGFLFPDKTKPSRKKQDYSQALSGDLRDDVLYCVENAARAGLETVVLDQTRPDIGLRALKVMVPGLRHFWPRFGPGRLYDVPVAMGLRNRVLLESELNPIPLYL